MLPKRRGKKKFGNITEEFIKQKNPRMVYAGKAPFDFMLARKKILAGQKPYIKIEVSKTRTDGRILFEISHGKWKKLLQYGGKIKPDLLVVVGREHLYFGNAIEIGDYLAKRLSPTAIQSSSKKLVELKVGPGELQLAGLLQAIPKTQAHTLQELILAMDRRR